MPARGLSTPAATTTVAWLITDSCSDDAHRCAPLAARASSHGAHRRGGVATCALSAILALVAPTSVWAAPPADSGTPPPATSSAGDAPAEDTADVPPETRDPADDPEGAEVAPEAGAESPAADDPAREPDEAAFDGAAIETEPPPGRPGRVRAMRMPISARFIGSKKTFQAKHRIAYLNLIAPRLNPLGLEDRFFIGYEYRLYDTRGKLKDGSHIGVAFSPFVSPAMARVGPTLTIMPLAILRLQASVGWLQHFGTMQFMQSWDSPGADWSTVTIRAEKDRRYGGGGVQAQLGALFQVKAGPIAVRNEANFYYTNIFNMRPGDDVWYDIRHDILSPNRGWTVVNDTDVLYVSKFGLTAGVRMTVASAFYPDSVYDATDTDGNLPADHPLAVDLTRERDPNNPSLRVGPMLAYTFFDRPEKRFNKPSLVLITQWWAIHRFRTGQEGVEPAVAGDSVRGMPLIALAFAFQGELWSSKARKRPRY